MGFLWGLLFGPGTFLRVLFEALGIFLVLIFAPIRPSPSLETRSNPPPPPLGRRATQLFFLTALVTLIIYVQFTSGGK